MFRKNKEGDKKVKIGIMTFWWSQDNYGQILQCYALQKYLRDAGHDAYLIRYKNEERSPLWKRCLKAFNLSLLYKHLKYKINSCKVKKEQICNDRHFDEFRKNYINQSERFYSSYKELKENPPEADVYIVGSDQVWNFSFLKKIKNSSYIHSYMLDFGKETTKKMSYAASWSMNSLSNELIAEIKPLLQKFSYVSVREENGIELCKQCGYDKAEFVCDPTMLLDVDVYRNLYKSEVIRKQDKKYLLLYMLNNECDFDIQKVYDFAKEKKLEVVYVTGNGVVDKREKLFATIPEWLYLIDTAEYIVTNSFHCCVFSSLFKKKYGVVKLKGKSAGMNTRMFTLFHLLGIEERFVDDDFSNIEKSYTMNKDRITDFIGKLS